MRMQGLSLLLGEGALEAAPAEVLDALERVEIDAALGERGSFRLAFRLDRGSRLPDRFLLASGNLVRVVLSTDEGGVRKPAMDGVVVTHSLAAGADGIRLEVGGEDLTLLMDLIDQ